MNKRLNILILSSVSPFEKSGSLVYDMYKSLKQTENDIYLNTKYYYADVSDKNISSVFGRYSTLIDKIKNKIVNKFKRKILSNPDYYMFNVDESRTYASTSKVIASITGKPDLIIYTFPQFFLNTKNLYELGNFYKIPIFIFPVDMAPLTGGCHYFWECDRYKLGCGKCPGLYSSEEFDLTFENLKIKKKFIQNSTIFPIANDWILSKLNASLLYAGSQSFKVNIVIDQDQYSPEYRDIARKNFNIASTTKVLFFGAVNLVEKRKGFELLLASLELLKSSLTIEESDSILVITAGLNNVDVESKIPFKTLSLGYLELAELPKAFQAADIFVSPSIEDAGPMMVTQSLMCGTPVVAFRTGAATSLIVNEFSGYISEIYNINGFANGIKSLIKMDYQSVQNIRDNCRKIALENSSYDSFNKDIFNAYNAVANNIQTV